LTKTEEQETIIINRSGRSTYLGKKSVPTTGATPLVSWRRSSTFSCSPVLCLMRLHVWSVCAGPPIFGAIDATATPRDPF